MIPDRIAQWWVYIQDASRVYGVYPYTLAAICDRESLGGETLTPPGPAGTGDFGHGHGLFQIDDRTHADLIAKTLDDGTPAWQDPASNAAMGASIFAHALIRFDGDELMAIAAYNAGEGATHHAVEQLTKPVDEGRKLKALDAITTAPAPGKPGNYVSDVLRRRAEFQFQPPEVA